MVLWARQVNLPGFFAQKTQKKQPEDLLQAAE
jgi:hypothetical protein